MSQQLYMWMLWGRMKVMEIFHDENGALSTVEIVILIGVAVLLAIVFRNAISELINTLVKAITENAKSAIDGSN